MKKEFWEIWINNKDKREKDFKNYLKERKIKKEKETKELIKGHIQKADHNLRFTKTILELKEFNDWVLVSSYYAIYHAALALCALKGYSTKNHSATLLILIKEFYNKNLNKEEIETIGNINLKKEDVLYHINARKQRSKANYSTILAFDKPQAEILRLKAIKFVNKIKQIIEEST